MHRDVCIIIPARIKSNRLNKKPLLKIKGKTMIERVCERAIETGIEVFVATDSTLICEAVENLKCSAIMTSSTCASGTDRAFEAFKSIDRGNFKYIINLQADMPFVDSKSILNVVHTIKSSGSEMATAVCRVSKDFADSMSNVKVVVDVNHDAIYFSRSMIPSYANSFLYHVGIYGFTSTSLEKFVNLKPSKLEELESLEQLRAIENKMKIRVCYENSVTISIDTESDLKKLNFFESLKSE